MASKASNRREQLRALQEAQARQRRSRRIIGITAAVIAAILVFVFAYVAVTSMSNKSDSTSTQVAPNATASRDGIVVNPGKAKAGVPVVHVYVDYQCPICKVFEDRLGPTLAALADAGDVQLVNHTMTFMDQNLQNTASSRAAYAATCADSAGVYSAFDKQIFKNQPKQELTGSVGYDDTLLRETIPAQVGIIGDKLTDFQACYDTKAPKDFIDGVDRMAYEAKVTGTPTIKRNDQVLQVDSRTTTPEEFRQMVLQGQ